MSIAHVKDQDNMKCILSYMAIEISNRAKNDNYIVILSFCTGDADYEKYIATQLKKQDKHIVWILYDVLYNKNFLNRSDDIEIKEKLGYEVILCDSVQQVECALYDYKFLHAIIGFNIQEAYTIPHNIAKTQEAYNNYIKQQRQEKSMLTLCKMLIKNYKDIEDKLFYVYYNENFEMMFNNFGDFYCDTLSTSTK